MIKRKEEEWKEKQKNQKKDATQRTILKLNIVFL
jgi:hypothetical protein